MVFVNSEIFGVHEWVKDICRRLAKAGYVALAPDLFVRAGDPSKTTDFKVVMDIVKAHARRPRCLGDTAASLKYLAAQPFADMKQLGVTGFCWGGGATWRCCETLPRVQGRRRLVRPAEGRRPIRAPPPIELVEGPEGAGARPLRRPGQGHPADGRRGHARGAQGGRQDRHEIIVYPDAQHGFLADYRASYNAEAAGGRLGARCWPSSRRTGWPDPRERATRSSAAALPAAAAAAGAAVCRRRRRLGGGWAAATAACAGGAVAAAALAASAASCLGFLVGLGLGLLLGRQLAAARGPRCAPG